MLLRPSTTACPQQWVWQRIKKKRKLSWYGHVSRHNAIVAQHNERERRGKPRTMWLDTIEDWTRLSLDNLQYSTKDWTHWRKRWWIIAIYPLLFSIDQIFTNIMSSYCPEGSSELDGINKNMCVKNHHIFYYQLAFHSRSSHALNILECSLRCKFILQMLCEDSSFSK